MKISIAVFVLTILITSAAAGPALSAVTPGDTVLQLLTFCNVMVAEREETKMKISIAVFAMTILVASAAVGPALSAVTPSDEVQVYEFVGKSERYRLGPAGIEVKYDTKNRVLTVIGTEPETPADGHFKAGDVLAAVNGKSLDILNPFVVIGEAITNAEATEGKLAFDIIVRREEEDRYCRPFRCWASTALPGL